jgi:putative tryptophan/tyrosine transport system substrate-binding protein
MKKNQIMIGSICLLLAIITILSTCFFTSKKNTHDLIIGIIQTASHPALDNAREGFMEELKNKMGDHVQFIIKNGQGSIAELHSIAKNFAHNSTIDGIFAIATPALQAIASIEKQKPIFISAVTDPHALGLITPDRNICGSSDKINISDQIELITKIFPNTKMVGIIFNTGEINSVSLVKEMKQALDQMGISALEIGITHEAEIPSILATAIPKIDLLWAPTDNTVASAITFIAQKMREHKKPFIASDNLLVEKGTFAAAGIDYFQSGKQAGQTAISVFINHKKPAELEIVKPSIEHFVVNKKVMQELGITLPHTIQEKTIFTK